MLDKIFRLVIIVVFAFSGLLLGLYIIPIVATVVEPKDLNLGLFTLPLTAMLSYLIGFIICGIVGFFLAPIILRYIYRSSSAMLSVLSKIPTSEIMIGAVGLIIALILANLIGNAASHIPFIGSYLPLILSIVLGIVGVKLAIDKKKDLMDLGAPLFRDKRPKLSKTAKGSACTNKILDTSVIIDGRIADICKTHFVEGVLIVPNFVLEELQYIADSADAMKRNRGRRGLDILQDMQQSDYCTVDVISHDYEELTEVDAKLVRLAQELGASVVTNDYNLNKVAELQGVRILNINELANAVKTALLPGEELVVNVIKEGKEANQGIAYLEDGTMIVIEGAKNRVGDTIESVVTTVLQTAAGKMVFAKVK